MPQSLQQRRIEPPRGPLRVLNWLLTKLLLVAVVAALGYLAYRYVLSDRVDEEIRRYVENKFQEHYHGLLVSVDSAHRVEGQGIEIRGLTVREVDRPNDPPLLFVERILTWCDCSLQQLASTHPEVHRVVVRRARVHAVRRPNGFWNVRHLFPPPKFGEQTPPIAIEDCAVKIVDQSHPEHDPPEWRELQLTLTPDATAAESLGLAGDAHAMPIRIAGGMTGDHFRQVRLEGAADLKSAKWWIRGEVEQLQFTPAMRAGLPQDLAAELAPIAAVSGNTHLWFDLDNLAGVDAPLRFSVEGTIADGRIDDERLPLPLTELSAKLFADNRGFKIKDLAARLGAAKIGLFLQLDGYDSTSPMVLRMGAENLVLDDRLSGALPEDAQRLWRQLSPTGILTGNFTLAFADGAWKPAFEAKLEQLGFVYDKFPYRMNEGEATVKLRDNLLTLTGSAMAGNSPVRFEADVRDPGPNWSGWFTAQSQEPMPIDDRLLGALTPQTREVVQSLNVRGSVQLLGRLDRRPGSKNPAHTYIEAEMCDCSVAYRSFPYPIDHVSGVLRGNSGVWTFANLKGSQGAAQIQASGSFGPDGTRGPLLAMEFKCNDVPLDDTLHRALSPQQQKLWNDIRPQGEIDVLGISLSYRPHEKRFSVEVDAQKVESRLSLRESMPFRGATGDNQRPVRIEPVWFPYAVDITSGTVRYRDGTLELSKLRGMHDKTKLEAEGHCKWSPEGTWSFELDRVTADRLQLDHDLLAALPKDTGAALAKAKFSGALGMNGSLKFAGPRAVGLAPTGLSANWDLSFDVEDGQLAGDLPVDHIHGGLRIVGGVGEGRWFSRGEVKLDSLFVKDVQITRVLGPFYVDSKQLLVGSWAERDQQKLPPRQLTAQLFDGLLTTDAGMALDEEGKFQVVCSLQQADLAKIVQECGASAEGVTGKTFGSLQVNGTTRGKHTWRGGGNVQLREADLYEVPLMVAMLKLLSIRRPSETAFTTSDIDFRIQGDDVILDRIDLAGDAISLKGKGQLYEHKQVDLLFYTQVGRQDFQAIRPLIREASPNFLLIEVTGTIDKPSVKKTPFPALNETLRDLFPDLARGEPLEARSEPVQLLPRGGLFRR